MIKEDVSNLTRPYGTGVGLRSDTTIASIILYSSGTQSEEETYEKNFLEDLDTKITQPVATVAVEGMDRDIAVLKKFDNRNDYYGIFNNITLTGVSESHNTIQKLHLNFSDSWNVFFFSDSPVTVNLSGGFLDNEAYPYYQEFMTAYQNYLSGAQATRNNMSMILSYDGKVMDGYLTSVNVQSNANLEGFKNFQMQFLVKKISWTRHNYVRDEKTGSITNDNSMGPDSFNYMSNKGRIVGEYGDVPNAAMSNANASDIRFQSHDGIIT